MQSVAGHSLLRVVPAWVGLTKMSGPMFFKEVEFARGVDARPCYFFAVLGTYLDRALSWGWLPAYQSAWAVCSSLIFGALLQTSNTAKAISSLISA